MVQGIEITRLKLYSYWYWWPKVQPYNHKRPVYSNEVWIFHIWTLPWQTPWLPPLLFPLCTIFAKALIACGMRCFWSQASAFQLRTASCWAIWFCEYRNMNWFDVGIKRWYQYQCRYHKKRNDMHAYCTMVEFTQSHDSNTYWTLARLHQTCRHPPINIYSKTSDIASQSESTSKTPQTSFAPSQWETLLQSTAVSHWLGTNLSSALVLQPVGSYCVTVYLTAIPSLSWGLFLDGQLQQSVSRHIVVISAGHLMITTSLLLCVGYIPIRYQWVSARKT